MNLNPFIDLISAILHFYAWILVIHIVLSWLTAFDVLNRYNPTVEKIVYFFYRITEPVLRRVRRFIPTINGIDLSPIAVFFIIQFINSAMHNWLYVRV